MFTLSTHKPVFLRSVRSYYRDASSWTMSIDARTVNTMKKEEQPTLQLSTASIMQNGTLRLSGLEFDRLQPSDEGLIQDDKFEFGQFVAREAVLDEEYWTAAWLRAETHWEGRRNERYADSYKRKFAEQEFNAVKRLCKDQNRQKCKCIVAVKKEEMNIKRSILKSIVGSLDLSIRYLLHGETFPGEKVKAPIFCSINKQEPNRYGYISNVCVSKLARRQGIAMNMLRFAAKLAEHIDVEDLYVHVHRNNIAALQLYSKMGFEMVDMATCHLLEDNTYLLRFKM